MRVRVPPPALNKDNNLRDRRGAHWRLPAAVLYGDCAGPGPRTAPWAGENGEEEGGSALVRSTGTAPWPSTSLLLDFGFLRTQVVPGERSRAARPAGSFFGTARP
jgi:hypothetical protein